MIKKLRKKLVAVAMLSLFIVLLVIMGMVNILNYTKLVGEADSTLKILKENNGSFPKPGAIPGRDKDIFRGMSPETPYETRYFSVFLDSVGNVSTIDTGRIAGIDTDEAAEYAETIIETGKSKGFVGQYRYAVQDTEKGTLIIFLYCGRSLSGFYSVMVTSLVISLVGMLAVFLLLSFFSGRIVKPISESYEKQKRFITDAGHELKTPLTIIDADAELVELDCGGSEWLDDIRKQTKRLAALTNDLIYLAKMEEENASIAKIEFPLSDVVEEIAGSFKGRALNEGKRLEIKVQPGISYCGDEKAVRQLVSILVDNAVKYADSEGDINISLETAGNGRAATGASVTGAGGRSMGAARNVKLEVYNTCEHIEAESVKRLFDRFYRAEQSRNSQTGGYGIGLSVAKAIVEAHKGKISAHTEDEKSLRITVLM